jgi:hypothetical protein
MTYPGTDVPKADVKRLNVAINDHGRPFTKERVSRFRDCYFIAADQHSLGGDHISGYQSTKGHIEKPSEIVYNNRGSS